MGIAEPVIGRAFARPVGSTHPTICHAPRRSVAGKSLLHTEKFVKSRIGRGDRVRLQQTSNDCICPDDKPSTRQ